MQQKAGTPQVIAGIVVLLIVLGVLYKVFLGGGTQNPTNVPPYNPAGGTSPPPTAAGSGPPSIPMGNPRGVPSMSGGSGGTASPR